MLKFRSFLMNIPEVALGVLSSALILLVFLEIVFRYLLELPVAWSEEAARFLFIWLSLIGAAVCTKRIEHFSFEMFFLRLSIKRKMQWSLVSEIVIIGVSIALLIQGIKILRIAMYQKYVILDISVAWAYASIPTSGFLMFLYSFFHLVEHFRGKRSHSNGNSEARLNHIEEHQE